jgi:RNA polymerase sigma factor (sigma-70 family)
VPSTSEIVIVTALRSGNVRRAVELLLDIYQDELFGYCARLAGAREAQSVYQAVLIAATEQLAVLEGRTSIRAWLFQLARGAILHYQRGNHHLFPGALADGYAPVAGPDDAPGLRLRDEVVERFLAQADAATTEILQLALWHGLSLGEVALVVGRSEAEVRRKAAAGLAQLDLEISRRGGAPS